MRACVLVLALLTPGSIASAQDDSVLGRMVDPSTVRTTGSVEVLAMPVGVGHEIELAALQRGIDAQNARLVACYETARHDTPTLAGTFSIEARLLVSGAIGNATSADAPPELQSTVRCMSRALAHVRVTGPARHSAWPLRLRMTLTAPAATETSGFGTR